MSLADGPRARRVLVVDDDPNIVELIVTRLSIAGHETRLARNGADALQRLADFRPEAMVLDINMPVLDGFGVLAHMKAQGLTARTPTLVLTARNNREDVAKAVQMGARDYLSKPFDDAQLLQRVGRLLARPRGAG
ncbi:MAG: response regulator [Alphaproteobacteria bacterium]|nr:response regulator [Alphaproteobacteria bacterium]MBU1513166.1 response regulator [Alphaproteobacteria bacterium]MBU2095274.1 response regulator [Alphaproteobacteria bacterium]MBU2152189.1 response regulator [Alphaproteobacteria bacterium]MBU2306764.1 response regulator [Alphaproteobacteria bacterium]